MLFACDREDPSITGSSDTPRPLFSIGGGSTSFSEEFAAATLDPAWEAVEFTGSRVYGFPPPANHYSLTDKPGHLRYYVDPMTHPDGFWRGFMTASPGELSCCAHDPGLEIRRGINGEWWLLEGKVDFHMPYANGRGLEVRVYFGDGNPGTWGVRMNHQRDVNQNSFAALLRQQTGTTILDLVQTDGAVENLGDGSADEPADNTYYLRVERAGSVLSTSWSTDGSTWTPGWSRDMGVQLNGLTQTVVITGHSWFVPAGSYADWDYVRLTPTVLTVAIDIKPGSNPNSINPASNGVIPVAILTTASFDAASVNVATVRFGATGSEAAPAHSATEDVDGDGDLDLVLHFRTQQTGLACGATSASLTGNTVGGQPIQGSDAVRMVPCR
jgi:hypothetical protein